jgi:hypothetical protein
MALGEQPKQTAEVPAMVRQEESRQSVELDYPASAAGQTEAARMVLLAPVVLLVSNDETAGMFDTS